MPNEGYKVLKQTPTYVEIEIDPNYKPAEVVVPPATPFYSGKEFLLWVILVCLVLGIADRVRRAYKTE